MKNLAAVLIVCLGSSPVWADEPEIIGVTAKKAGMDWRVEVTILHHDTGWDHYANGWEILDAEGNRLDYRLLRHPHVDEQPFTRGLTTAAFADGTREFFVRASCSVDGWSDQLVRVELEP